MANLVAIRSGFSAQIHPVNHKKVILTVVGTSDSKGTKKVLRQEDVNYREIMSSSSFGENFFVMELTILRRALPMIPLEYKALCDDIISECLLGKIIQKMNKENFFEIKKQRSKGHAHDMDVLFQ